MAQEECILMTANENFIIYVIKCLNLSICCPESHFYALYKCEHSTSDLI